MFGIPEQQVREWVETGRVRFVRAADGTVQIPLGDLQIALAGSTDLSDALDRLEAIGRAHPAAFADPD